MIIIYLWSNEYGGDILTIDELYVKPGFRHQGVATQAFQFLLEQYANKAVALQLEVTPSNRRALVYYRNLGFADVENRRLIRPFEVSP